MDKREKERIYRKERYHSNPEIRKKLIESAIEWRKKNKHKHDVFRIQVRINGELTTVYESKNE